MRRIQYVLLLAVCLIAPTMAQDNEQIADLSGKAARVARAANGGRLTEPSNAGRPEIVSAFLRGRHDEETATGLVVESENPTERGSVHMRFRQQLAGLEVYGTYVKATLSPGGELVSVLENLASLRGQLLPSQLDFADALRTVLQRRYPGQPANLPEVASAGNSVTFARGSRFYQDPVVTRVVVPMNGGRLRVGYLVETWDTENQLWHSVVGGNGRVLFEELRTAGDTYKIYPNAPDKTPQTVAAGPGAGSADSPSGWVTADRTSGNNVNAYLDRDNNNGVDPGGQPVSASKTFEYTFNTGIAPTDLTNQMAAVTNLFYLNNLLHDKLRRHGFNEAAGNFQTNNFGLGGLGNDPVNAEAQDGGGTNNANFATPGDGSRPRMQMYLWNTASPSRDGDVDSDIVYHEYGHGLTWRMIGGMQGRLSGALGEGMSDVVAIFMNGDDLVAEYSTNNSTRGIRRFRYNNYPNTYSDVLGNSVHNDGEIYAATMWYLRQQWLASGRTMDQLWSYVIDGMNFTPSFPAYEDMRDGILAAMPTQAEDCIVWDAFAKFGIGVNADGRQSSPFRVTEDFSKPAVCSGAANTAPQVTITAPANGSSFQQGTSVAFAGSASDLEQGNLTGSLVWTSNIQPGGTIGGGGSFSRSDLVVGTHTITASVTDAGGLTDTETRTIAITAAPAPTITLTTSGFKVKGVQNADLTWTPTGGGTMDVYLGSSIVAVTPNDGAHTYVIGGKGAGSFTFKVCQTGTTVCSNTSTVNF